MNYLCEQYLKQINEKKDFTLTAIIYKRFDLFDIGTWSFDSLCNFVFIREIRIFEKLLLKKNQNYTRTDLDFGDMTLIYFEIEGSKNVS